MKVLIWSSLFAAFLAAPVTAQSPVAVHDSVHNLTFLGYNYSGVENFQGIRYGRDTSGSNRFRHPQAFTYPNGTTVQATAAGASCPQNTLESLAGITVNEGVYNLSEDCLNLRIARPAGTKQNANLPVMVWIYGGSDETGSTNYTLYDPTALVLGAAAKDTPLIFVSMNYRVNIFGFANNPAVRAEKSLNSGLLDQRLALEWIQSNIAAFGGNPKEVTLFGESDGGTGVGLQMTAYGGQGSVPFQRGIMESGSPAADPGVSGNFTLTSTTTVAQLAGCSSTNSTVVLDCLRQLPMTQLLKAVIQYENITASELSQDIFFPVVDGDFIPAAPSTLLRTGQFHKNISVIAGWNYNDGSIFTSPTLNNSVDVCAFVNASYPHLNTTTLGTLMSLYPINDFAATAAAVNISPYFLQGAAIWRDVNFACPAIDVAHHVAQYGSQSYLYELNATTFDTVLQLANASFEGVIHVSDVPFVFNDANLGLGITAAQQVVQTRMSGSWARFAATGDPSGNANNTFADWTQALNKTGAAVKGQAVQQASVRVIGGPSAGQHVLNKTTQGGSGIEPQLLTRCAFINSVDFYQQIQT
ncbi:hypothetical protein LTR10_011694 [Elasticomyces elasticus]|uniref:Carboxylesterase type B domain-containing protein n=1 Tax=Exophiala sideris TaxID=1016849 RepID=A0ABR0JD71_9EURO|nr:hypothetical protein LTR10_011694 [Elasticomyces elasticus]KAK5031846.1 hypothetical protein LTS07_004467 [Exophiala sideris]KAK5040775.1 hypothetical protein LTR13_003076 [Exophiala sideris]KAK5061889.1 hypothetical protein LTR69_005073 [Exophiala sideris]KAK5184589.1 hypothetical protein LTR44_003264 [Eurotiomycetes sp. CCFEE 6388]